MDATVSGCFDAANAALDALEAALTPYCDLSLPDLDRALGEQKEVGGGSGRDPPSFSHLAAAATCTALASAHAALARLGQAAAGQGVGDDPALAREVAAVGRAQRRVEGAVQRAAGGGGEEQQRPRPSPPPLAAGGGVRKVKAKKKKGKRKGR